MCGGVLSVLVFVLLGASILNYFLKLQWLAVGISVGTVIIFSIYLIHDTQLIIGGRHRRAGSLGSDEYIFGALMLYLDIIILFMEILKALGKE